MAKRALKVEFSNRYQRIMNEFTNLPSVCMPVFSSALKRDALRTVKNFKEGIKANSLGLVKLKDGTIKRKMALGYPKPTYPLYGIGDESKRNSYMNMLRVKEKGQTITVYPSREKHHSERLTLFRLWDIHEHGVIIRKGKMQIKRGSEKEGDLIRIPPRPALLKAVNRAMAQRKMAETVKIIRTAIILYINQKSKAFLDKASAYFLQGLKIYDVRGR
jgi:hypothetical protein